MDDIEGYRRQLAALSGGAAPSLAEVQAAQARLRKLKRDVLTRVEGLRDEVQEQAAAPRKGRVTLGEAWDRRQDGAKTLLADVRRRVIGMVDQKPRKALESLAEINDEIDARLAEIDQIESRLAHRADGARPETRPAEEDGAGDDEVYAAAGGARPEQRPRRTEDDEGEDDLYAKVGAAVRRGETGEVHCPHCGKGLASDDRFCRHCGHRLAAYGD